MKSDAASEFQRRLAATLAACRGQQVRAATVLEMAFIDDPPTFVHRELRFVQASVLELNMQSGLLVHFTTWQNDASWALKATDVDSSQKLALRFENGSIFRTRGCDEFRLGEIKSLDVAADGANAVQEISFVIGDRTVFLRAGEVYEDSGGRLTVRDRDESVLVFFDPEAYRRTAFNVPLAYAAIA